MVTIPAAAPAGTAVTVVPSGTTPATSQRTVCPTTIFVVLSEKSIVDAEPTNVPLLFETAAAKLLTPVVLSPSI